MLSADEATWDAIAADVRGGMDAFRQRRLTVRQNLHLGVGFLAATSGITEPGRLRFHSVQTRRERISVLEAGQGEGRRSSASTASAARRSRFSPRSTRSPTPTA